MCKVVQFKNSPIDISGKHFSDFGIMWNKLCESIGIGLDILQRYDDWYILDDGFYYFKTRCVFEELFMRELAKECGVRCVEFMIASNEGKIGVISKLYRTKGNQYHVYNDFCQKYFNHIPNNLIVFKMAASIAFGEENTKKLMNDIFNMISFDMFSGQWDREEYNFFFECNSDGVRLAPLCDNGMVFTESLVYKSPFGIFSLSDINIDEIYKNNLFSLIKFEQLFFDKLVKLLDIDIDEVLKRTISKYGIIMKDEDMLQILNYFDSRKKDIEYSLKLSRR